jgi:catechol 2,3-dioxygenase-like lactoylglutathione lyase family enzyme
MQNSMADTGVALSKPAIDLGIVARDGQAMLTFYRDVLGFVEEASTPFHAGGVMYRLWCGDSLIKIVVPGNPPQSRAQPGPIESASGIRYWTMRVSNLEEMMSTCANAGAAVVVPVTEVRAGVTIGMVEDPDGNWVEFVTYAE